MGLDMYIQSANPEIMKDPQAETDLCRKDDYQRDIPTQDDFEIAYWRKENNIHGWMERLYRGKGGQEECFNCVSVQLKSADLDKMEQAIENHETEMPATQGFFFGSQKVIDWQIINYTKKVIKNAREEIKNGRVVYYTSSW